MYDSDQLENSELLNYRYPFCDIFIMKPYKKKCYIKERIGKTLWPQEVYKLCDIARPKLKLFGDFYLNCPDNAENYLDRTYGENWRYVAQTQNFCHLLRERKSPFEFDLVCYEPAKPFQ